LVPRCCCVETATGSCQNRTRRTDAQDVALSVRRHRATPGVHPMASVKPAPRHLVCTKPVPDKCQTCGMLVLVAYVHGERTIMAPERLNPKGEAVALVAAIKTYVSGDHRDGATRLRTTEMIQRGMMHGDIHARHVCGMFWSTDYVKDCDLGYDDDMICPF
jgi:hypothetical protein